MMNSENMKLMIIVVNDVESDPLLKSMLDEGYRVTRIASSGGFLRRNSSTLLMGVESTKVARAIQLAKERFAPSLNPGLKRVSIFVLKVDKFEHI